MFASDHLVSSISLITQFRAIFKSYTFLFVYRGKLIAKFVAACRFGSLVFRANEHI